MTTNILTAVEALEQLFSMIDVVQERHETLTLATDRRMALNTFFEDVEKLQEQVSLCPVELEDYHETNPGLHLLYVKYAIGHLRAIDDALKTFSDFSNLNMHGPQQALYEQRLLLVKRNMAYADADEIIRRYNGIYEEEQTPAEEVEVSDESH